MNAETSLALEKQWPDDAPEQLIQRKRGEATWMRRPTKDGSGSYMLRRASEQYRYPTWGNAEIASHRVETKHSFEQDNLPYQLEPPEHVGAHRRATQVLVRCASRLLQARPMSASFCPKALDRFH